MHAVLCPPLSLYFPLSLSLDRSPSLCRCPYLSLSFSRALALSRSLSLFRSLTLSLARAHDDVDDIMDAVLCPLASLDAARHCHLLVRLRLAFRVWGLGFGVEGLWFRV